MKYLTIIAIAIFGSYSLYAYQKENITFSSIEGNIGRIDMTGKLWWEFVFIQDLQKVQVVQQVF